MKGLQQRGDRFVVGSHSLTEVADTFGTPLYVYDGDGIRSKALLLMETLGNEVELYYSMKANPSVAVCRLIHRAGVRGVETASQGEIIAALNSGFEPSQVLFAGPGKTSQEIDYAVVQGVQQINAESVTEIHRIQNSAQSIGRVQRVGVRVNPACDLNESGKISTSGAMSKFGVDERRVPDAIHEVERLPNLEFGGLHFMFASQVLDHSGFIASCRASVEIASRVGIQSGTAVGSLNFGGGIGVRHEDTDPEFDLPWLGEQLSNLILEARREPALRNCRFILEPGRAFVSSQGYYLSSVVDVKELSGQTVAILDGGINHALLPITANKYKAIVVNRSNQERHREALIGGPLCTSVDQWRSLVCLPEVRVGDIVALMNSGAYGLTASLTMFLSRGVPAEVILLGEQCKLIRSRSLPEHVLDGQLIPGELS